MRFDVTGITGSISSATLRLHCRQGGSGAGNGPIVIKTFTQNNANWENEITWDNQASYIAVNPTEIGRINWTATDQWYDINLCSVTPVQTGGTYTYCLALEGLDTDDVSFDSKESTNHQSELVIETINLFAEVQTALPKVEYGEVTWGDYDADGDLDLFLNGSPDGSVFISEIYRNDNGSFIDIGANLEAVSGAATAWGDYDMDNDLDLLLSGYSTNASAYVTKLYRNNGGTFAEVSTSLPGVGYGDITWGNFNNDDDLDILLNGYTGTNYLTQVYRGTHTGSNRTWTAHGSPLAALYSASVAWGFNNADDFPDILLAGTQAADQGVIKIYRNKQNANGSRSFVEIFTDLPAVETESCVWDNYDDDWDLDLAITGSGTTGMYERTSNNSYELIGGSPLFNLNGGDVAWGNYDGDGDLDLLITGLMESTTYTQLYRNDYAAPGGFTLAEQNFTGVRNSAVAWGDYDADGDLDLLLTGTSANCGPITKLYRNLSSQPNASPSVPTNLRNDAPVGDELVLRWNESTDDQTPNAAVTYNLMVGTTPGGVEVVSPMSLTSTGKRIIPASGNAGTNNYWTLSDLSPGTYYWRVQAIDNTFKASAFSSQATFTISSSTAVHISNHDADREANAEDSESTNEKSASPEELSQALPAQFVLSLTYPNPFNLGTQLNLELPEDGHVQAIIYDLQGQEVLRLRDEDMVAGYNVLQWDGRSAGGEVVSSAAYLVKIVFDARSGKREEATRRLVLIK